MRVSVLLRCGGLHLSDAVRKKHAKAFLDRVQRGKCDYDLDGLQNYISHNMRTPGKGVSLDDRIETWDWYIDEVNHGLKLLGKPSVDLSR